jgi:hypothetical protein
LRLKEGGKYSIIEVLAISGKTGIAATGTGIKRAYYLISIS